jgi:septal ring factor EnvC (AmiA/AmiB activator)
VENPFRKTRRSPAALHRLPEIVAHVAEALWMQALDEGRRRAHQELKTSQRLSHQLEQNLEARSHVLTLREGELDSRLRDRDRTIEELNPRLRELTGLLHKEQATRESQLQRITTLKAVLARRKPLQGHAKARTPPTHKRKRSARRAVALRSSNTRGRRKRNARNRK